MSNEEKVIPIGSSEETTDEKTVFYTPADVAKIMQCSMPMVYQVMHRNDFPLIKIGSHLRVYKNAFEKWAMERRD